MNASSKAASLKLVLPASISNLAMYSSVVMPIVIFRACSLALAILSLLGSLKVLVMPASNSERVVNVEEWDRTALVSFSAHTCAIPLCMNERAYRIFILSSEKLSSCIVTAMQTDRTNCSALSLLPSKVSGSAAFAPLGGGSSLACSTGLPALQPMRLWLLHLIRRSGRPWPCPRAHCWRLGAGRVVGTGSGEFRVRMGHWVPTTPSTLL